jgi:hypothetical protein
VAEPHEVIGLRVERVELGRRQRPHRDRIDRHGVDLLAIRKRVQLAHALAPAVSAGWVGSRTGSP